MMKKTIFALAALTFILSGCDMPKDKAKQETPQPEPSSEAAPAASDNEAEPAASDSETAPAASGSEAAPSTSDSDTATSAPVTAEQAQTENNSLNWAGTYQGTLPCTDCEGIQITLALNSDQSYTLKEIYQGKKDNNEVNAQGQFTWDDSGSIITLDNADKTGVPYQFLVGENMLMKLSDNGKPVQGDMAEQYTLKKQ
jgi:uncharacterized lipoprotein NlpE involved in copper resistance